MTISGTKFPPHSFTADHRPAAAEPEPPPRPTTPEQTAGPVAKPASPIYDNPAMRHLYGSRRRRAASDEIRLPREALETDADARESGMRSPRSGSVGRHNVQVRPYIFQKAPGNEQRLQEEALRIATRDVPVLTRMHGTESAFLGKGAFGRVETFRPARLTRFENGWPDREIAFKVPKAQSHEAIIKLAYDVIAAKNLKSQYLMQAFGIAEVEGKKGLVLELVKGMDPELRFHYARKAVRRIVLTVEEYNELVKHFASQLITALAHLQYGSAVHLDIKPANMRLSDKDNGLKLVDYGCMSAIGGKGGFGTIAYTAPEIFLAAKQKTPCEASPKNDVWSAGQTLHQILCGAPFYWHGLADDGGSDAGSGPPSEQSGSGRLSSRGSSEEGGSNWGSSLFSDISEDTGNSLKKAGFDLTYVYHMAAEDRCRMDSGPYVSPHDIPFAAPLSEEDQTAWHRILNALLTGNPATRTGADGLADDPYLQATLPDAEIAAICAKLKPFVDNEEARS